MGECVIGPDERARVDADDGFFFGMGPSRPSRYPAARPCSWTTI